MTMTTAHDFSCGITRDANGRALEIEPVDFWWNAPVSENMPIYRIGDALYCAAGWNGECYCESFRVLDKFTAAETATHEMTPIYRYQDEGKELDEDGDDNDTDFEIVGFAIC